MRYILSLLGHAFLNPVIFIYFSFVAQIIADNVYIKGDGTNIYHLNMTIYLIFSLFTALIGYILIKIYNRFSQNPFHLKEVAQSRYFYLQSLGYTSTALTLITYSEGMEGNIMGFIFFPMLILGSIFISLPYFQIFFNNFQLGKHEIILDLKIRIVLHLFNPLLINSITPFEKSDVEMVGGPLLQTMATFLTIAIFYVFFLGLHWLIFKVFKKDFSVDQFFGQKEYFSYWLPFVGGFYLLVRNVALLDNKWVAELYTSYLGLLHFPFVAFCLFLLFKNYINYLKKELLK